MMKRSVLRSYLCVFAILTASSSMAQMATRFFEPNMSITYDTTRFKPYLRDASIFRVIGEQIEIRVTAALPEKAPLVDNTKATNTTELEKYYNNTIDRLSKNPGSFSMAGNPIIEYDRKVYIIDNFRGYGFVEEGKSDKKRNTSIYVGHISPNDYSTVSLRSFEQKPLTAHYPVLTEFLKGFKSYSATEIADHVAAMQKKYTLTVTKAETIPASMQNLKNTYVAVVRTKEPLEHKIKEVYLFGDYGSYGEIFTPNENGEVYITSSINKKGMIVRKGHLVFYSNIGKQIIVPFSFQYEQQ